MSTRYNRFRRDEIQVKRLILSDPDDLKSPGGYIESTGGGLVQIYTAADVAGRTGQEYQLSGPPKVGDTAGWVVAGATNLYEATLPASQTGSKLIVPVRGLKIGNPALETLGDFRSETIPVAVVGMNQVKVQQMLDRVGYR